MKTIKRYPNRKLYDTETSRYITLEEIAEYVRQGGEVRVIDMKTGEDITSVTMAQVLVGEGRKRGATRLVALLQSGGEFLHKAISTPVMAWRDEAGKTFQRLLKGEPGEEIRELVAATQKAYEEVQRRVDERLQVVLQSVRNLSPVLKEMGRLREEVEALKRRVEALEEEIRRNRQ